MRESLLTYADYEQVCKNCTPLATKLVPSDAWRTVLACRRDFEIPTNLEEIALVTPVRERQRIGRAAIL